MKTFKFAILFISAILLQITVLSQDKSTLSKSLIIKTNLLNLIAQGPAISVEKQFTNHWSLEVSYVQGHVDNWLFRDYYGYNGFLLRAKKYSRDLSFNNLNPYTALYLGNLNRMIYNEGSVDHTGFFSFPTTDFQTNSIRGGGSLGVNYITSSRIIFDAQTSLGYGRHFNLKEARAGESPKGYLDAQLWLSIGYCF